MQDDFDIAFNKEAGEITVSGRFDASQVARANAVLNTVAESAVVDFAELTYISSAGLGVLLSTQKRLMDKGKSLKLVNLSDFVANVFRLAGFHIVFEIE